MKYIKITNNINVSKLVDIIKTKEFDPEIENYFPELFNELGKTEIVLLANQYLYFYDFYNNKVICPNSNINRILGYSSEEINTVMLYEIIHPADRLLIYKATIKSIYFAHLHKNTRPFQNTFSMDFRIRKKCGKYIRVLRNTGVAVNDRLGNMVFSFAHHTDITKIKTSSVIKFDYRGDVKGYEFPDEDLSIKPEIFSKQEKNVLYHLVYGKTSKSISEKLFISKHTVDTHRRNMLHKAKLKNTPELIVFALEYGLV